MASNDKHDPIEKQDPVENQLEPRLKNPDRRRVLGAAAGAAAALGTAGQAASQAVAPAAKEFRRMPGGFNQNGTQMNLSVNLDNINGNYSGTLRAVIRKAFQDISNNSDSKYLHTFRIVPRDSNNDGCACGCS
jgi:hypothetical protein